MNLRSILVGALACVIADAGSVAHAADRAAEWTKVKEAVENKQAQTALRLLKPLETAAFNDQAWGEGTKALLMRARIRNGLGFNGPLFPDPTENDSRPVPKTPSGAIPGSAHTAGDAPDPGGLPGYVRQLEAEIPNTPESVRPVLRWFQARCLHAFTLDALEKYDRDTSLGRKGQDDYESWPVADLVRETARRYQSVLDDETTRGMPVNGFAAVLSSAPALGDAFRPTIFDLIAHSAIGFLDRTGDINGRDPFESEPRDPFQVPATSPALDDAEAFLKWSPPKTEASSHNQHIIGIYQKLLAFHHDDKDRTAFLHCDLERLRWAGRAATGTERHKRRVAAIRAFVSAHPESPLAADAREDEAMFHLMDGEVAEARQAALAGARAFPNHPFGRLLRSLVASIEATAFRTTTPSVWPSAGETIVVSRTNVRTLWFRIYPRKGNADNDGHRPSGILRGLLKTRPVNQWRSEFDDPADFRRHRGTVPGPAGLAPGDYWLLASPIEDFGDEDEDIASTAFTVSSIHLALDDSPAGSGRITGLVVDTVTGAPVANARIAITCREPRSAADAAHYELRTGADGAFVGDVDLSAKEYNATVVAETDGSRVAEQVSLRQPWDSGRKSDKEPGKVAFFTDRTIYRPGDPIRFKGILYQNGDRPHSIPDTPVNVVLTGPGGLKCGEFRAVSNAYGSFAGEFVPPPGGLPGSYEITAGERGSHCVAMEEYKKPGFRLKLTPHDSPPKQGTPVTVKGSAIAMTNAPVDGAKVEWVIGRYSYYTGEYGSRFEQSGNYTTNFASGTTLTGADGSFTIRFTPEADSSMDPAAETEQDYEIQVSVTDPAGETEEESIHIALARAAFGASLGIASWQDHTKPVELRVTTGMYDGRPFPAKGVLKVHRLKEPAACAGGIDLERTYAWEATAPAISRWDIADEVWQGTIETAAAPGDEASATVAVPLPPGCYRARFETADSSGVPVCDEGEFIVLDTRTERFAPKMPFHVDAPTWKCPPGKPFTLLWGSGLESARACVEWVRDGKILKCEWSVPGRTQQVFSYTPDESLRGGFDVRVRQFTGNRAESFVGRVGVPWPASDLKLRWIHQTNKLAPGAADTWTLEITGPDGKPPAAELVATLYDAALDELGWEHKFNGFGEIHPRLESWYGRFDFSGRAATGSYYDHNRPKMDDMTVESPFRRWLDGLDDAPAVAAIEFSEYGRDWEMTCEPGYGDSIRLLDPDEWTPPQPQHSVGPSPADPFSSATRVAGEPNTHNGDRRDVPEIRQNLEQVVSRRNLRQTAFFYPQLATDEDGKIRMTFTMPEGLGRWRFLGFAHDKNLRSGHLEGETVTAKDLMVQPNPPRFLREGDEIDFTVRLSNQSDRDLTGLAKFTLSDAGGATDLTAALGVTAPEQAFAIPAKQSRTLAWRIKVPDGCGFLRYQARAAAGDLTDGEEGWLPVLPRRVPVTDSLALRIRGAGEVTRDFAALGASGKSDTLQHESLQVQVVSRPAWYAVMALPYLMEFPHECAEQTFSRLYANALGHKLVNSDPKIRRVFEVWRAGSTLDSPLLKNQDLAGLMLDETPWLRDAADDSARRRRVGMLFDDNRMTQEISAAQGKLAAMQLSNGMWPWFPGGRESEFITAHIVAGFGELRAAGVVVDLAPALNAAAGLDRCLTEYHRRLLRAETLTPGTLENNHLDPAIAHLLYSRSFFLKDRPLNEADAVAHRYFLGQAKRHWAKLGSRMTAAQLALALWRNGEQDSARLITRAFRETAVNRPDSGMSWPAPPGGGWWWDAPVETHAMMIAAFAEIDRDAKAVDDCRAWLIEQHRDGDWQTTTATTAAIYGLLVGPVGDNPLAADALVRVALGGKLLDPGAVEPGTGYYECKIPGPEVKPAMAAVTLTKTNPGVAWASVHWRYFEDVSKLAAHESGGLKIEKHLLVRSPSPTGPRTEPLAGPLRPGDELVTRLVVTSTRELEFVHLKDERGSGTEPANVLSGYRWGEGVGYYEVTRDAATHFFIDRLPKGTHVFEHSSRIQHAGTYQTGAATIRCMYAPEIQARSASTRLAVAPAAQ